MTARSSSVVVLAVLVCVVGATFFVKENRIYDDSGRERLFHGVNVVYKSSPYFPITDHFDPNRSFSVEDAQLLNSLGLNVIRLGAQWAGVEPSPGNYSLGYMSQLAKVLDICEQYNITVFFDAHQDSFSERFCGEGVPLWATESDTNFPFPLEINKFELTSKGIPSVTDCAKHDWPDYEFAMAGAKGYDRLYNNADGLRDHFAQQWAVLAAQFRDRSNLLAFELLNEPFAGDIFSDPLLLYPGHADKVNLQPFYDAISEQLRPVDTDRLIMFEPCTWTDEYGLELFDTGFEHAPGGSQYGNKSILSYHYYPWVNQGSADAYFSLRQKDMERLGTAGFVTEFSTDETMDVLDQYVQSWAYWEYKSFLPLANETDLVPVCTGCSSVLFPGGVFNKDNAHTLSRTFPQYVQGRIKKLSFNDTTSDFSLDYTVDTGVQAPTEIYLNEEYRYPDGYNAVVTCSDPSVTLTKRSETNRLVVSATSARRPLVPRGSAPTVTVTITRA